MLVLAGATREEMREAQLPLAYRDSCANLLIPLNRCRKREYYLPWKCEVRSPGIRELLGGSNGNLKRVEADALGGTDRET